jgi:hypothetical protein
MTGQAIRANRAVYGTSGAGPSWVATSKLTRLRVSSQFFAGDFDKPIDSLRYLNQALFVRVLADEPLINLVGKRRKKARKVRVGSLQRQEPVRLNLQKPDLIPAEFIEERQLAAFVPTT